MWRCGLGSGLPGSRFREYGCTDSNIPSWISYDFSFLFGRRRFVSQIFEKADLSRLLIFYVSKICLRFIFRTDFDVRVETLLNIM